MAIGLEDASPVQGQLVRPVTVGWFLKRSLIGIAILLVAMGSLAWLTYASIDPNAVDPFMPQAAETMRETPVRVIAIDL